MTFKKGDGEIKDFSGSIFEEYSTKIHHLNKLASKVLANEEKQQRHFFPFRTEVKWKNVVYFVIMHALAIAGLIRILGSHPLTIIYTFVLHVVSGIGITVGAHRLFAHRSYRANFGFRLALVALQTTAGENSLYTWVRDHRQHHRHSDTDADPHNARRGLFFSHMGWLMMRKLPEVKTAGRAIQMRDLERDPIVMFQKRWFFPLYLLLGLVIPVSIPVFLWSEDLANSFLICYAFRTVYVWHVTWFVNSLAHWEGSRPFDKTLKPVDSAFVAKATIGEGWHNFHHRFPFDYTTSLEHKSYHWSTSIINWASRHGWVWDLRRVTPSAVRQAILQSGDGSVTPDEVVG